LQIKSDFDSSVVDDVKLELTVAQSTNAATIVATVAYFGFQKSGWGAKPLTFLPLLSSVL